MKSEYDPNFDMDLFYFEDKVTFVQEIKSKVSTAYTITAEVYSMVCDEERCLPPDYVDFEFSIGGVSSGEERLDSKEEQTNEEAFEEAYEASDEASQSGVSDEFLNAVKWEYFSTKGEGKSYELHCK